MAYLMKMVDWKPVPSVFKGIILSAFAIIGTALIAKCIDTKIFSYLGRYSLGVLVLHKFFLVALQVTTSNLRFCFCNGIVIGLLSTIVISCIIVIASIESWKVLQRISPFLIGESKA